MDLDVTSYILGKQAGGTGGTTDYSDLTNKPSINSVELSGNKTSSDLGVQSEIDSTHKLSADLVDDTNTTNKFVTASDKTTWSGKQDALVSGTNIKTINNQSILGSGDITISGGGDDDFGKVYLFRGDAFNTSDTQLIKIYKQIKADYDNGITSTFVSFSSSNLYDETTKFISYGVYRVENFRSWNNKLVLNSIEWRLKYIDNYNNNNYSFLQLCSPEILITFDSNGDITSITQDQNILKNVSFLKTDGYGNDAYTPTTPGSPTSKKYVDDKPTTYTGYDATKTQVLKNINGTLTWVDE